MIFLTEFPDLYLRAAFSTTLTSSVRGFSLDSVSPLLHLPVVPEALTFGALSVVCLVGWLDCVLSLKKIRLRF